MKNIRKNAVYIKQHKNNDSSPLVCLTAYSAPIANILDEYCDILLVGDTVGMVLYGMNSTLGVSVDIMINHGKAVVSHSRNACVVVDMPFSSYQESKELAFRNAAKILSETGCQAVKLEGGNEMSETVEFLVNRGIPVMGHVGLTPQSFNNLDNYKSRGNNNEESRKIINDAKSIEQAGAFSIVVEGVKKDLAEKICNDITIPTIGIGASEKCDGQVLVTEDMIGLFSEFTPKFVKKYCDNASLIKRAVEQYSVDVRNRKFPTIENCYK